MRQDAVQNILGSRLGARILTAMAAVLVLASVASLALFVPLYRHELTVERQAVSTRLGAFLQITLENAMLKRDIEGLRDIVDRLGKVENVASIAILNPELEVRFSSDAARLGTRHRNLAELCPDCGLDGRQGAASAAFLDAPGGGPILRSVNAVANREPCSLCHGPADEHPVNGFLIVDYDAGSLKDRAWRTAALLSAAGFAVVFLALAAAWWTLQRFVLRPVAVLTGASRALAEGDMAARVGAGGARPSGDDEIADLGRTFDDMAARLSDTMGHLKERDRFLQGLIDAIPDGIRVLAEDHSVVAANKEFCRQSGRRLDEVLAQPCYRSSHGRSEPCAPTLVVCPLVALAKRAEPVKCMHAHVRAGEEGEIAVEVVAAPLVLETRTGPRRFVVEAIRDLSQDMQISQEQRLSEIGQLATGIAHEIHNPLASIRFGLSALTKTIGEAPESGEALRYIALVASEIERCIEVTGRLMRLSQAPAERGVLIDLVEIARDVTSLLSYEALTRRIDLRVEFRDRPRVVAGESEMGMVLLNLVQNAFHATPANGRVTISDDRAEDGSVVVEVADSGVGIAKEDLAAIFQPFWSRRADGSTGSGLGLSICKAIVARWGGAISVRSRLGEGTTFRLTFPNADRMTDAA